MTFASPLALTLLLTLPVLFALSRHSAIRRTHTLRLFGITAEDRKPLAIFGAIVCIVAALARPSFDVNDADSKSNTGDTVFLLDVSRSMLADDVSPNRLEYAKTLVFQLSKQIPQERVALVAFAGTQSVECPLTIDSAFFEQTVAQLNPSVVTRGGTRIGDAIRFALASAFDDVQRGRKQLVILTDGGDQNSKPNEAVQEALHRGVQTIVIGMGDENVGALVPTSVEDRTPLLYHGKPVHTRLETASLQSLGGQYTSPSLARLLPAPSVPLSNMTAQRGYGIAFVALALILLLIEEIAWKKHTSTILIACLIANTMPVIRAAESAEDWAAKGLKAFRDLNPSVAVDAYEKALKLSPGKPELLYNLAIALYADHRYDEAQAGFQKAAGAAVKSSTLQARSIMGTANAFYQLAISLERRSFGSNTAVQAGPAGIWRSPFEVSGASEYMLRSALSQYREVLHIKPEFTDAAYNIEVIERRLKALQEQNPPNPRAAPKTPDALSVLNAFRPIRRSLANIARQPVEQDW